MKPIDELMTGIKKRFELGRQESLEHLQRQTHWVLGLAVVFLVGNVILYLHWLRRPSKEIERDAARGAAQKA